MKKRDMALAGCIAFLACAVLFAFSEARAKNSLSDFSAYWTACRLFTQNPYSLRAVNDVQQYLAANRHDLLVMRNPPWTALVFFPLAQLSYPVATALWTVISILLVFFSTLFFWRRLGGTDDLCALLIAFTLAPTFVLIDLGQITSLLLAGAALFLYAIDKKNFWLAGIALLPFTFKPHLSIVPLAVVFGWVILQRHWAVLWSFISVMTAAVGLCFALNRSIGIQYVHLLQHVIKRDEVYPTLGGVLAGLSGVVLLKFAPLLAGLAFVLIRAARARKWDLAREMPILLSIGVAISFYSFIYDEILAIPLLLMAFLTGKQHVFITLFVFVNATIFLFTKFPEIGTCWWSACAWIVIYGASLIAPKPSEAAYAATAG